jgi:tetratricopeptide (TPR) repeat protein
MADFDRSILLAPRNSKAYLWRGEAKYLLGDKPGAILDYGECLALDPASEAAYFARAKAYERLGRYEDALGDASRAKDLGYPVPPEYLAGLKKGIAPGP